MDTDDEVVDAEIVEDDEVREWVTVGLLGTPTADFRVIEWVDFREPLALREASQTIGHEGARSVGLTMGRLTDNRIEALLPVGKTGTLDLQVDEWDETPGLMIARKARVLGVTMGTHLNAWSELNHETAVVLHGAEVETPDEPPVYNILQVLREGLAGLDDQRALLEAAGDYESLALGAADIALLRGDLGTIETESKEGIARVLDAKWIEEGKMKFDKVDPERKRSLPQEDIDGLGRVKVVGGNERKNWESEKLLRRLIFECIVNEDGEILDARPDVVADLIFETINDCIPITGSLSWRVGQLDKATQEWSGLRRYGIDPSDFCDEIEKTRTVTVPKRSQGSAVEVSD